MAAPDVKKVEGLVADLWNARMGAEIRSEDLATAGSLVARPAGPWRTIIVNDILRVDVCSAEEIGL